MGYDHHARPAVLTASGPADARILQASRDNEIVTWQTQAFGGLVFASTKDPIVKHGLFQIRPLDHYLKAFTTWILREDLA